MIRAIKHTNEILKQTFDYTENHEIHVISGKKLTREESIAIINAEDAALKVVS